MYSILKITRFTNIFWKYDNFLFQLPPYVEKDLKKNVSSVIYFQVIYDFKLTVLTEDPTESHTVKCQVIMQLVF